MNIFEKIKNLIFIKDKHNQQTKEKINKIVDEASMESFPASDPPAWSSHKKNQDKSSDQ